MSVLLGFSACVVVTALAASVAACGGDSEESPDEPAPDRARVVLRLDRGTAEPGSTLGLTVENRHPVAIDFGLAFQLERRVGRRWDWINERDAVELIAFVVEPGRRHRDKVFLRKSLEPGRYRIAKSFTLHGSRREVEATVEFSVSRD